MNSFGFELIDRIQDELRNTDPGVPREILNRKRPLQLERDLVLAIQGVRRCGKSTLLRQIARLQGIEKQALFINFEDPRLGPKLDHTTLDGLVKMHSERSPLNTYFFFDEIQNVTGWEKWLHVQLEAKKYHFVITGSNSTLLSGKLGSSLTGRHVSLELFPFSFSEYLKLRPGDSFERFLASGGFPRALTYPESGELLRTYFSDIIERDVRRNISARSSLKLMQIAKAVFESTGSEISLRKLARGFDSTADTISTYVDAFESAYLCLSAPFFSYSERKSRGRARKYYPIDLGLRSAVTAQAGLDLGKKLETYVFLRLRSEGARVSYWRGKREVDFVIETIQGIQPIQVTWGDPHPRHEEALAEFKGQFPNSLPPRYINAASASSLW